MVTIWLQIYEPIRRAHPVSATNFIQGCLSSQGLFTIYLQLMDKDSKNINLDPSSFLWQNVLQVWLYAETNISKKCKFKYGCLQKQIFFKNVNLWLSYFLCQNMFQVTFMHTFCLFVSWLTACDENLSI